MLVMENSDNYLVHYTFLKFYKKIFVRYLNCFKIVTTFSEENPIKYYRVNAKNIQLSSNLNLFDCITNFC